MTPKELALILTEDFFIGLEIKDYKLAVKCAIYTTHQRIQETFDIERIRFLKQVVIELEKL
jgi:hypothetical protein